MKTKKLNAKEKKLTKGTKVEVNGRHYGMKGCTGRVSRKAPELISGHYYFSVRISGAREDGNSQMVGESHRFLASELNIEG